MRRSETVMAILPIVEVPDPRLRLVSKPVEAVDDVRQLSPMIDTMYDAHGIGLAAIQVGVDKRAGHRPSGRRG
jgi:peptide deformylase